ncbi:MAG: segregation/condensation protein A [Planctomycetota bacterium]|nr:segregation/condensation protein A [Planctomycetota bacterium]
MSFQDEYTVRLSAFEGPLDLLLYLIRRAEVDIHDIPIVEITDQFLGAIEGLKDEDSLDIDAAGEFLVMAATLVELKSRTLAPRRAEGEDGEGESESLEESDPRQELVRQLLAYQRYRSAAGDLDDRREAFSSRWPVRIRIGEAREETPSEPPSLELEDVHAGDLFSAFERIMEAIDPTRLGEHAVEYDDTPIALHQEDLLDRVQRHPDGRLSLREAFEGRTRGAMIGLFLALLELARQRKVVFHQVDVGEIVLELNQDGDEAALAESDGESGGESAFADGSDDPVDPSA